MSLELGPGALWEFFKKKNAYGDNSEEVVLKPETTEEKTVTESQPEVVSDTVAD